MTDADTGEILLADVALPVPLRRFFTYEVPRALVDRLQRGMRVVCPLGSRRVIAVVLATRKAPRPEGLRAIASIVDESPALPEELLDFLLELGRYYLAPIGDVIRLALPPLERHVGDAVREPLLFREGASGLATRKTQWAVVVAASNDRVIPPLRGQALEVWEHLVAHREAELSQLAKTWKSARPAVKRLTELGLVNLETRDQRRDPFFAGPVAFEPAPELTLAQSTAASIIGSALAEGAARTFLLHGVTGSGKTEVYLAAIAAARQKGRGALVLVPEIALTPQLIVRYRARFGDDLAVLHSALTQRERYDMWSRLHRGEVDVAIGARSALFAPIKNLGLIIVDEEHDSSFKQDEGVRYHARDMAILRAHRGSGVVILGSATPSLETEHLTRTGRAEKLRLPGRARAQSMPRVERVDLRRIGAGPTGDKRISVTLHRALEEVLAKKEQAILFLNRRGFAPSVRCEACGNLHACPSCSVALTFHKREGGVVRCHYCGYGRPLGLGCGKCGANALVLEGLGTEKLEETLRAAFPTARIARLDRDVASGKGIEKVIDRVRTGEVDILVGTQMVTKGHDLPNVTLVGVINADAALSIPDFRASERAFQLLVQVAGRAGRGDLPGKVLVQTYDPDHPAIVFAATHDVDGFLEREIEGRRELGYPPFSRIALVRVEAIHEADAKSASDALSVVARRVAAGGVEVLGPAPAPLARLRNRFRYRIMLRGKDRRALRSILGVLEREASVLPRSVRVLFDIDPMQLL